MSSKQIGDGVEFSALIRQFVEEQDTAVTAELMKRTTPILVEWVWRLKFSHLFNEADIQDIVQETWIKVAKSAKSADMFRSKGTAAEQEQAARAWVRTIMRNTAFENFSKTHRVRLRFSRDNPNDSDNPIEQIPDPEAHLFAERETLLDILEEIVSLNPRERQILRLFADGASTKEIAQQMVMSPGRVSQSINEIGRKVAAGLATQK